MSKTIRLSIPDWQAGNNPVYYFGAQLLNWLAPKNQNQKTIQIPIVAPTNDNSKLLPENGVTAQSIVKRNVEMATKIINKENPDKIITLGGNCLVSQAPFNYLHEKYGDKLGIIWIDAHPDISTPEIFPNEHAMVLGNLLGKGDPQLAKLVKHPLAPESILYVGLQELTPDEKDIMPSLGINYQIEKNDQVDVNKIEKWVEKNGFEKIAIHFDLDVLDPNLFFDQFFNKPGVSDYGVSNGDLNPDKAISLLSTLENDTEVVGLTIAEYLPWSALKLRELMEKSQIFN